MSSSLAGWCIGLSHHHLSAKAVIPSTAYEMPSCPVAGQQHVIFCGFIVAFVNSMWLSLGVKNIH